jgi:hypothetical protein
MAWIVGLATDEEIGALQKRGLEVQICSAQVRDSLAEQTVEDAEGNLVAAISVPHRCAVCGKPARMRAVEVYVDVDLFDLVSGPGWNKNPDGCATAEALAARLHKHGAPAGRPPQKKEK